MQLTKYKYIRNQKPKFDGAVGADGNQFYTNITANQQQYAMPIKTDDQMFEQAIRNSIGNKSKTRNPINYNQAPDIETKPISSQGVTDYAPDIKGFADPDTSQGSSAFSNFKNTGGMWSNALMSNVQAGYQIYNSFNQPVKSENGLLATAGTSQGQINGVQYQKQNSIDAASEISDEKAKATAEAQKVALGVGAAGAATGLAVGASIGTSFGPVGSLIGAAAGTLAGVFIGNAAKKRAMIRLDKRIANAQQKIGRINIYNSSGAQSQGLQQDYYNKYGNTQGQVLNANRGKDNKMMFNKGKNKVWSPNGYVTGPHNSWVGKGESILNFNDGKGTLVTNGKVGVDNQRSSVQENDDNVILGNDMDLRAGTTFAKQGAPFTAKLQAINEQEKKVGKYAQMSSLSKNTRELYNKQIGPIKQQMLSNLQSIAGRQAQQHQYEGEMKAHYAEGKTDWKKFLGNAWGGIQQYAPSALGIFEGLQRNHRAAQESIESPNSYYKNIEGQQALAGLAGLRYDVRPQLNEYRQGLRFNKYNIDQTGGLTAGQKLIARNSMYNDYINNAAKLYSVANEQNNAYKSQYYDALMKYGDAERNAMTNAARYDNDIYAKAETAKRKYMDQAMKDVMENIYRADKRTTDDSRWKDTLGIYQQEQDNKKANLDWNRHRMLGSIQTAPKTTYILSPLDAYRMMGSQPITLKTDMMQYNPWYHKLGGFMSNQ